MTTLPSASQRPSRGDEISSEQPPQDQHDDGLAADEVTRLRRVYDDYDRDHRTQARWADENPGNAAAAHERHATFVELLSRHGLWPLGERRLVELGCGSGKVLEPFLGNGANPWSLLGVDLIERRVVEAKKRLPNTPLLVANGEKLPLRKGSVSIVVLAIVLSSLQDDAAAQNIAREIDRVLAPGGCVLIYDLRFGNPRNPNVRAVNRRDIARLFPDASIDIDTLTVLPPLARRLGRATPALYPVLRKVPFLRSHVMVMVRPRK